MCGDSREDRGVSWWPRANVHPQNSDEPYRLGCDRWCVLDGFTLGRVALRTPCPWSCNDWGTTGGVVGPHTRL